MGFVLFPGLRPDVHRESRRGDVRRFVRCVRPRAHGTVCDDHTGSQYPRSPAEQSHLLEVEGILNFRSSSNFR